MPFFCPHIFHTLLRNITHLAVITRKTNIKLCILKGGLEKSLQFVELLLQVSVIFLKIDKEQMIREMIRATFYKTTNTWF